MNAESYLLALIRVSAQAGVLVLLVLLAQWLFRKQLTPRWRCALWFVVIVRLLLPFSPGSAASIFNLVPTWEMPPPTQGVAVPNLTPLAAQPRRAPAVSPAPVAEYPPTRPGRAVVPSASMENTAPAPAPPAHLAASPSAVKSDRRNISWVRMLLGIWLAGVLILGLQVATCSVRLARKCRRLPAVADAPLLALRDECARQLGLRRPVAIVESAHIASPALFGVVSPRLILPQGFLAKFSAQELRFVLLHELAHLQRRDLLINWLVTLLQVAHWFNPLIWLGFSCWRSDRELACDALALEAAGGDQSREYGRTILHLLETFTHRSPSPGLVGILEDRRRLRQRIGMIARFRPGQRRGLRALALLLVLAVIGLTDAQTPPAPKSPGASAQASPGQSLPARTEERVGADPLPEVSVADGETPPLTVTVLDPGGKPLAGAEISLPYVGDWAKTRFRRLTDDKGQFVVRLPNLPKQARQRQSQFSVSAGHKDYASRTVMWTAPGGDVYVGLPGQVKIQLMSGVTIGGMVRGGQNEPLADVRVLLSGSASRGFTANPNERRSAEYSEIALRDTQFPAATTDTLGRWLFAPFPSDLEKLEVTFVRPDGARETFSTEGGGLNQRRLVSWVELKAQKAAVQLSEGVTVHGVVVDEAGRPLSGVTVNEGYGLGNIVRVSEFTTDAQGRFQGGHRVPRQWIYTASRADRATVSVVAPIEPDAAEVRIVVPPAKPWRARVTDESGNPVAAAECRLDTYRTEAQIIDWSGQTDADGRVVWTNAPAAAVTLYVTSRSLGITRKIRLAGGEPERQIVLNRRASELIQVRVTAEDAGTQQPIRMQSVAAQFEGEGSPFKLLANPEASECLTQFRQTDFRVGTYPSVVLRIEATGYEPLTTEPVDFDAGDQNLHLTLRRHTGLRRLRILQPDGRPATGGRLWAHSSPNDGILFINEPTRYSGDRLVKVQADEDGRLELPVAPEDLPVVVAHANGFLETTMAEIRRQGEVRLQAFGAAHGQLRVAGKPRAGISVCLTTLAWSPPFSHRSFTATTGTDGRFEFRQIPPGEYKLYRWALPKRKDTAGVPITETRQLPVTIVSGQTNTIEDTTTGRTVMGQAFTEPKEAMVDWLHDVHTLSLQLPQAVESGRPVWENYATLAAFQKASRQSSPSAAQMESARQARTYALEFEKDGSFRIDDVPPGRYELHIRLTRSDESGGQRGNLNPEEIGALLRDLVIPDGTGPLDLGTLAVPMNEVLPAERPAPVTFNARTLDGQPMTLAGFQDKNVLVVFWASWSERSLEQLAELEKLQAQFAPDARIALVGVSLDESSDAARKIMQTKAYPWMQGWVDADGRAKLTAAFDVNTLPAVFLLDPERRIVARELEGERLAMTVKRALAKR